MLDYKIHLKNIRVMMSLGIHPDEKKYHQAVLMDIALTCQKPSDFSIQAVVDYDTLSTAIIELCQARHFDLLEELAEVIANHCLALPWVVKAKIKIAKPDALQGRAIPWVVWQKAKK